MRIERAWAFLFAAALNGVACGAEVDSELAGGSDGSGRWSSGSGTSHGGGATNGAGAATPVDLGPWLGNWSISMGSQSTTCGASTGTDQLNGLVVFELGSEPSTLTTTAAANNCQLTWYVDADGNEATLQKDQTCTVQAGGASVTVFWTQSSMKRSGDLITGSNTGAANNGCSFTQQYTLTKD
jgi:hypothetical protein